MGMKEQILANLKEQWKMAVRNQYQADPEKVKNANIEKNADEIMSNPIVRRTAKQVGITIEDIKRILTEIRDEVAMEGK